MSDLMPMCIVLDCHQERSHTHNGVAVEGLHWRKEHYDEARLVAGAWMSAKRENRLPDLLDEKISLDHEQILRIPGTRLLPFEDVWERRRFARSVVEYVFVIYLTRKALGR